MVVVVVGGFRGANRRASEACGGDGATVERVGYGRAFLLSAAVSLLGPDLIDRYLVSTTLHFVVEVY